MSDCLLWPKPDFSWSAFFSRGGYEGEVEAFFQEMYDGMPCVLLSSGRAAIATILQYIGCQRNDYVWVSPYSSHCVLNAISLVGTPCPIRDQRVSHTIVSHQWGIPFYSDGCTIEDSADSLCLSGQALFPNDGRFEIFSLPKIIGSVGGAIVVCQKDDDAKGLRSLRDSSKKFNCIHTMLKFDSFSSMRYHWDCAEIYNKKIARFFLKDIKTKLHRWDDIIKDRLEKMELLKGFGIQDNYKTNFSRLPSVWLFDENAGNLLNEKGVSSGVKHIMCEQVLSQGGEVRKVLVLPLHYQIPEGTIRAIVEGSYD